MADNFRVVDVAGLKVPQIPWRTAALGLLAVTTLVTAAGSLSD